MHAASNPYLPALNSGRAPQRVGALVAVAVHALALTAVLSYQPARSALLAAAPIMVDWIAQPRVEPRSQPKPRPKPVAVQPEPKPVEPAPIIAAANETPAPMTAPAPPPASVAAPEPAPLTMPVFNADYLDNPAPSYPALSRRLHEEGRVLLRVLVNPAGRADEVQVQSSSGHSRLDTAARETVRGWKFVPAKRGAEPVAAWVLIPVSFRLEG
jgi:protein TonB